MNSIQLRNYLLLFVVGLQLITTALEAAQAGSKATAETERKVKKIKVAGGKKIVRSIKVLEPKNVAGQPQATANNHIDVSPAINIRMPTNPNQGQLPPVGQPQPNLQPIVNSNLNNASPAQEPASDQHLPQDLKSQNAKIRQVEYRPRKKLAKIVSNPTQVVDASQINPEQEPLEYIVEEPNDIEPEAVVLETPGLPGVPVTVYDEQELPVVQHILPVQTTVQQPKDDEQEVITVQVPKDLDTPQLYQPESTDSTLNVVKSDPILDIVPYQGGAPNQPANYQIDPSLLNSNPMLQRPMVMPHNHIVNNMPSMTNAPYHALSDIGNNKSVNMSNMGNHNSTFINAPVNHHSPTPLMQQAAIPIVTKVEAPLRPRRRVTARKYKNKRTVQSQAPSIVSAGQMDPRVVVPPIYIQYNQMPPQQQLYSQSPIQPMVSQPPPIFLGEPMPASPIRSFPAPPFPLYNIGPMPFTNAPLIPLPSEQPNVMLAPQPMHPSQQLLLPPQPTFGNYMPPFWGPDNGVHPMAPLIPFVKYPYPVPSYGQMPPPGEYPFDYSAQLNAFPMSIPPMPMIRPIQYPPFSFPYAPYPIPMPVAFPMRQQHHRGKPAISTVVPIAPEPEKNLDIKQVDIDDDKSDKFKKSSKEQSEEIQQPKIEEIVEEKKPEIQYIERKRIVPIDYDDEAEQAQQVKAEIPQDHKEQVEWTTIKVPKSMGSTAATSDLINLKTLPVEQTKVQEAVQQRKFKTITERVPITSTITDTTSSILPNGMKSN